MSFVDWFIDSFIASHIVVDLLGLLRLLQKVTVIFSLLPLRRRKSDNYRYRDSWKSGNNNVFTDLILMLFNTD